MEALTVLVVDDDASTREWIASALGGELGVRVVTAADGATALLLAEETRPDLILLDMLMPGYNGFEVARRLAADPVLADTPVLGMTGSERYEEALRAGCDEVLAKPLSVDFLLSEVRRWLGEG